MLKAAMKRTPARPNGLSKRLPKKDVNTILAMHEYRRVSGGSAETAFINRYIKPLGARPDAYGNYWMTVGDNPRTMFSAHTDTVHREDGRQGVELIDGVLYLKKNTECLGADDGAGVWLLRELILHGVPGVYVFHRDEESGGRGSQWVADNLRDELLTLDHCIAFDRAGYGDIITHQAGGRCCSDTFAKALGVALNMYPSGGGVFTDSANYTDAIPECTNVSVGYHNQHGPIETLDVAFLIGLRDQLLRIDYSKLPVARDPNDVWLNYSAPSTSGGSMSDLVRAYPDDIAEILLDLGYDEFEVEEMIFERTGEYRGVCTIDF